MYVVVMMKKGLKQVKKKFVPPGSNIFLQKLKISKMVGFSPERAEKKRKRKMRTRRRKRKRGGKLAKKGKGRNIKDASQIFHSEWKLKVIS